MHVTELNIYPVKSLRGIAVGRAELGTRGLAHDRQWMVVDQVGRFVTQRQLPAMARIAVRLEADRLVLEHPDAEPLSVELARDDQPRLTAYVWDDACQALDEGDQAADWLTGVLGNLQGSRLRLVRFDTTHRRPLASRSLQGEQAHTAFADGFPFLLTAESSLEALNEVLREKGLSPVPMSRFRPNIVVQGSMPFAENGWGDISTPDGRFRLGVRKPCQRCKITTVDQHSGDIAVPGEPLRTLVAMRTVTAPGGYFGQNAILLAGEGETIALGDGLQVGHR